MTDVTLTRTRIHAGHWEGLLTGAQDLPSLEVLLAGAAIPGVTLTPMPGTAGRFAVRVPIPAETLNEGVQTFVIRTSAGQDLTHFTVITGVAVDDDLRAEIDLLRAELDLLKHAFRRHCAETLAPQTGTAPTP